MDERGSGFGIGDELEAEVRRFMDDRRISCLWFVRDGYYPRTAGEWIEMLRKIQAHCDLESFKKAGELICRLQGFNEKFVDC